MHTCTFTCMHTYIYIHNIYIHSCISLSLSNPFFSISLPTFSDLIYDNVLETFVDLSETLLPLKLPYTSPVFEFHF